MSGCHHCTHFQTDYEWDYYDGLCSIPIKCLKRHFEVDMIHDCREDDESLRQALAKGDNCPDFAPLVESPSPTN